MARKRYMLLKDSYELKKGTIVEEECDDGTQNFKTTDKDSLRYKDAQDQWNEISLSRDTVMKNPEWFEEVVTVNVLKSNTKKIKSLIKKYTING